MVRVAQTKMTALKSPEESYDVVDDHVIARLTDTSVAQSCD
jgi:hypothetical protein